LSKKTNDFVETYASFSDKQLLRILHNEIEYLTPAALTIFKAELSKRNLKIDTTESSVTNDISISIEHQNKDILHFIQTSKLNNENDFYILGGLLERGIEENDALSLIDQIPKFIENNNKKNNEILLYGIAMLVSGIAINTLPLSKEKHIAVIVLANAILILGILRTFHGFLNKRKFEKIIKSYK
jgi:hypothetical protein